MTSRGATFTEKEHVNSQKLKKKSIQSSSWTLWFNLESSCFELNINDFTVGKKKSSLLTQNDSVISGYPLYPQDFFWPVCFLCFFFAWADFIFTIDWKWFSSQIHFHPLSRALGGPCVSLRTVNQKRTWCPEQRAVNGLARVCCISAVNPQIKPGHWAQLIWFNGSLQPALLEAQTLPCNAGPSRVPEVEGKTTFQEASSTSVTLIFSLQSHISSTG